MPYSILDKNLNEKNQYDQYFSEEEWNNYSYAPLEDIELFKDLRVGLFLHVGISSIGKVDMSWPMTEKNIRIIENEIEVASFYQLVEIKEQEQGTVAHILIKENYPTLETDEFNIFDEYYYINGTMYMCRKTSEEEIVTKFSSTWDVFWEIAKEKYIWIVLFVMIRVGFDIDHVQLL